MKLAIVAFALSAAVFGQENFYLKGGDRVVFFGDSITAQRLYTTFVETYAVTRFPTRALTFVHSGWGGDRVTGGAGGGVDERLRRDVLAYQPTVVTIMLGMNDGRVRAFDEQIFRIYANGYRRIIKNLKSAQPGVRITAIEPSPFDDVTRKPGFAGGYNGVLLRFADFVRELATAERLHVADLNRPVTAMLERAYKTDAELSRRIIPDRVHPGASGHLIMAAALLKAWNAPAVVSAVEIDASARKLASAVNSTVSALGFRSGVTWTQLDRSLPVPVDLSDAATELAVKSSDFQDALNRQIVKVTGLPPGPHTLRVDDEEVATRTAEEWAAGVNLSGIKTPMWAQAAEVHALTLRHNHVHFARWRELEVALEAEPPASLRPAIDAVDGLEAELVRKQRAAAQPKSHQFVLVPGDSQFRPIFNGTDLGGWHLSRVSPHGDTQAWKIEEGILTGTQDRPRNGGIVLTDRKYRNFEISLELRPDYSCDSGLFLRSTEKGEAYQVMLDYLDGGAIGGVYGEGLKGVEGSSPNWRPVWKNGEWNHLRARIEGDVPHIRVWLNGIKITDWRDTANHLPGGAIDGMIALQVHAGDRWIPGGKHRFRNIRVRELP